MSTPASASAQRLGKSRPATIGLWHSGCPRTLGSESDARRASRRNGYRARWQGSPGLDSSRRSNALEHRRALEEYDRWFDRPWGMYSFGVELKSVLKALAPLSKEMRVLDAGCGTGRFTAEFEARGATVVGLDLDRQMLDIAATRTAGQLVVGDAGRIPLADGAFDCVVAIALCEFAERPDEVFAELARVTRLGGLVVVGALNPRSPWGLRWRRRLRRTPWTGARFLAPSTLVALAGEFGHVSIGGSLFAPGPIPGARILGPFLERVGRLAPGFGAFQLIRIERSEP